MNYTKENQKDDINAGNDQSASNFYTKFSLGYEGCLKFRKVDVFYGFDVYIDHNKLKSEYKYTYQVPSYDGLYILETSNSKSDMEKTGFGMSPLLGVRYYFNPHISISTETRFFAEYYEATANQENGPYYPEMYYSKTKSDGFTTGISPLGIVSVNIHL